MTASCALSVSVLDTLADLELRTAAELDAEVEAALDDRDEDREHDHDGRDRVPDLASADEVERARPGVEVVAELGETAGHQESFPSVERSEDVEAPASSAALRSAIVWRRAASLLLRAALPAPTGTVGARNCAAPR